MHRIIRSALFTGTMLTLAVALAAQQPARDGAVKPAAGTAVVAGTIVSDEPDGKPIRRVTVTLSVASSGISVQRVTTTDDAGRFVFTRLPAGNYGAPRASKAGYVPTAYGEKRTGGIGTPITLGEGQRLTITMKMLRGAVITGALIDQGGKPAIQTSVQATQVRVVNGERTATSSIGSNSTTTDDRGVYRIYGLAPGDYVIVASPRASVSGDIRPITDAELQWAEQQLKPTGTFASGSAATTGAAPRPAQAVAYSPVYYPGATDAAGAALVTVTAGQERSGVDFGVQFVPTARIEGTIADQDGRPPQNAQMNLISKGNDSVLMSGSLFLLESMMLARPNVVNGTFSMAGVKPGQYTLIARASPRAMSDGQGTTGVPAGRGGPMPSPMTMWATTDITVDGVDQSGIALRLQPGMTLTGRVAFDGATLQPPTDLSRVSIRLSAAPNPSGVTVSVGTSTAQIGADGIFKMEGVTPGKYLLSASAPSGTPVPGTSWIVKSAMVGGVDAADVPFEIAPDQNISNAVITFTDKTAEISGTLLDAAGHPTPEFSIILFPTDPSMWSQRSRRIRPPARASTDGKFKFTNLLPGEYYLAALTDFEPNDYYRPAFLEQVAAAAMKIKVAESEKKVQDLKIAGGTR